VNYFDEWGSKQNPIRQSDLSSLFGGMFGCAKRFALNKIYPIKKEIESYHGPMGSVIHKAIENYFAYGSTCSVEMLIGDWEKENGVFIQMPPGEQSKITNRYSSMMKHFLETDICSYLKDRVVDIERAFLTEIDGIWVAGTIDLIVNGKSNKMYVVDFKTGALMSQFEMDFGYQTSLYTYAVKHGEFFLKPDSMESGNAYYESYKNTKQKNKYNKTPKMFYCYLEDSVPVGRKSTRKSKHKSTDKMANENGEITITKGQKHGPIMYESFPRETNWSRLSYSLKTAIAFSRSGIFPESISSNCERCNQKERCLSSGELKGNIQQVLDLMDELGIEPD